VEWQLLVSLLARLIAREEGFGIPGAIPTTHHNPGDLLHSPHSFHSPDAPNAIGQIDNDADGWWDLEQQLRDYVADKLTLSQMIYRYAPPQTNNTAAYLAYICQGGGWTPDTLVSDALKSP
jgi:hypothetical protein